MTTALTLAIALCEAEGYAVFPRMEWVTPVSLARDLGKSGSWVHKKLHSVDCPAFHAQTGPTGRIVKIRLSPELRRWLSA